MKFASRLALSILVVAPTIALSACAEGSQLSAYATDGNDASSRATQSEACRSARQTASIVREMQAADGGIPFAIPAECERGTAAKAHAAVSSEARPRATDTAHVVTPFESRG